MVRAYVDMVRWEDRLREHPFYTRIALGATKAYLLLNDQPDLAHGPIANGPNGTEVSEEDRKKALKKAKKEQQRLEKIESDKREARKAAAANAKSQSVDGEVKKEDADPLGNTLVQTKDALKDALKFLAPLLELNAQNIEAQCLGFEVYIRQSMFESRSPDIQKLILIRCVNRQIPTRFEVSHSR
jgi:peptide alpha-N-acetyltransferase